MLVYNKTNTIFFQSNLKYVPFSVSPARNANRTTPSLTTTTDAATAATAAPITTARARDPWQWAARPMWGDFWGQEEGPLGEIELLMDNLVMSIYYDSKF